LACLDSFCLVWVVAREGVGLGSGSLGCRTFFFATGRAAMRLLQAVDGFVG
jgi:hypothetical protein